MVVSRANWHTHVEDFNDVHHLGASGLVSASPTEHVLSFAQHAVLDALGLLADECLQGGISSEDTSADTEKWSAVLGYVKELVGDIRAGLSPALSTRCSI